MSVSILNKLLEDFSSGREMAPEHVEQVLDTLIAEDDESILRDVFVAWNRKGIEENEIYEIAKIMRGRMKRVNAAHETFVDIVGTGGSKAKTFNVSTAASFVVAGAGVPVAKHGNKAATSNSGSADVLSELGIDPAADAEIAERCLNEIGICFMFAPNYHRLSPTLGKVRRSLGFPTIFNCVGPLCNPASAPHQLIGVWDIKLLPKMARALKRLGTQRSLVVHGESGLDEIALQGATTVAEVTGEKVRIFELSPFSFGLGESSNGDIRSVDSVHSAGMIRNVLLGKAQDQAAEDIVVINAAAALFVSAAAGNLTEGVALARQSLRDGDAHRKLEELASTVPA
jgi:anthranilate phosphoribosyltransferase